MLGMSDALKGLYAYRADLERRIATFQSLGAGPDLVIGTSEQNEQLDSLQRRLNSVLNQIDAYTAFGTRWQHSA